MQKSRRASGVTIISFALALAAVDAWSQDWQQVPEIDSTYVYTVAAHHDALYAITPTLIYRSADAGATWQVSSGQPPLTYVLTDIFSHADHLYAGTHSDGVFRSGDGGQSWQSLSTGLPLGAAGAVQGIAALGDSLYVGTNGSGVHVLNLQNPAAWTSYNSGLFQYGLSFITTSGNNLIASAGLYLFVRPRSGSQWREVQLDSVAVQRHFHTALPLGQYLYVGTNRGVHRGTLDAQDWQRADIAVFPNRDIVALAAHESRLIAGLAVFDQHWIFTTDNTGITWIFRAHEFAGLFDLFVSGDRLWAARTDGLWYVDLRFWTGVEAPASGASAQFHLGQNYPNPFNPSTRISFTLPQAGHVELKLHDLLGRETLTLLSEFKTAGSHTIDFNAGALASGVYVYRLRAGAYQAARKLVLMR